MFFYIRGTAVITLPIDLGMEEHATEQDAFDELESWLIEGINDAIGFVDHVDLTGMDIEQCKEGEDEPDSC